MVEEKILLTYGLEKKDLDFFKMSGLKYNEITTEIAGSKIEDILKGIEPVKYDGAIPNEKVILINGFNDKELNTVVKMVRATMGKGVILAVVTETSASWTFSYLLEHLIEEREWYKKNGK